MGSKSLQWSFLMALGTALLLVLSTTLGFSAQATKELPWTLLSHCCVALNASRLLVAAGSVSDSCQVVPALLNTILGHQEVDYRRQCVTAYIRDAEAGFYMLGVRVTGSLTMKAVYFTLVVGIQLVSQAL